MTVKHREIDVFELVRAMRSTSKPWRILAKAAALPIDLATVEMDLTSSKF